MMQVIPTAPKARYAPRLSARSSQTNGRWPQATGEIKARIVKDFDLLTTPTESTLLELFIQLPKYLDAKKQPVINAHANLAKTGRSASQILALGKEVEALGLPEDSDGELPAPSYAQAVSFRNFSEQLFFLTRQSLSGLAASPAGLCKLHQLCDLQDDGNDPVPYLELLWGTIATGAALIRSFSVSNLHFEMLVDQVLTSLTSSDRSYKWKVFNVTEKIVHRQTSVYKVTGDAPAELLRIEPAELTSHSSRKQKLEINLWRYISKYMFARDKDGSRWRKIGKEILGRHVEYPEKWHYEKEGGRTRIGFTDSEGAKGYRYANAAANSLTMLFAGVSMVLMLRNNRDAISVSTLNTLASHTYLVIGTNVANVVDSLRGGTFDPKTLADWVRGNSRNLPKISRTLINTPARTVNYYAIFRTVGVYTGAIGLLMSLGQMSEGFANEDATLIAAASFNTAGGAVMMLATLLEATGVTISFLPVPHLMIAGAVLAIIGFVVSTLARSPLENWIHFGFWGDSDNYWGQTGLAAGVKHPWWKITAHDYWWTVERPNAVVNQINIVLGLDGDPQYGNWEDNYLIEIERLFNVIAGLRLSDDSQNDNAIDLYLDGFAYRGVGGAINPAQITIQLDAVNPGSADPYTLGVHHRFTLAEAGIVALEPNGKPCPIIIPEAIRAELAALNAKGKDDYISQKYHVKRDTKLRFKVSMPYYHLTSGNFNADLGPLNYREVFRED